MVNFRGLTSVKVAIMGMEGPKPRIICGCCPSQKWLEIVAIFQIILSITLIITGSVSLANWERPQRVSFRDPRFSVGAVTVDQIESQGYFKQRSWTREHVGAILIYGLIFSVLSLIMSSILLRAASKKILRLLYIWPVWVSVDILAGWISALVVFQVNWLIIFLLIKSTLFMLFTVFLIVTFGKEIKKEGSLDDPEHGEKPPGDLNSPESQPNGILEEAGIKTFWKTMGATLNCQ